MGAKTELQVPVPTGVKTLKLKKKFNVKKGKTATIL